jgi:hypothetical protein
MGRSKELFIREREQSISNNFLDDTYQAASYADAELSIAMSININTNYYEKKGKYEDRNI